MLWTVGEKKQKKKEKKKKKSFQVFYPNIKADNER